MGRVPDVPILKYFHNCSTLKCLKFVCHETTLRIDLHKIWQDFRIMHEGRKPWIRGNLNFKTILQLVLVRASSIPLMIIGLLEPVDEKIYTLRIASSNYLTA